MFKIILGLTLLIFSSLSSADHFGDSPKSSAESKYRVILIHNEAGQGVDKPFTDLLNFLGGVNRETIFARSADNLKLYVPLYHEEQFLRDLTKTIQASRDSRPILFLVLTHGESGESVVNGSLRNSFNFTLNFKNKELYFPSFLKSVLKAVGPKTPVKMILFACHSGAAQEDLMRMDPRSVANFQLLTFSKTADDLEFEDAVTLFSYLKLNLKRNDFGLEKMSKEAKGSYITPILSR